MRARGSGHIALISSLAAWHGLPRTPAYSASKAALKAYGEALHGSLRDRGVRVTVVMPGYIRTSMADSDPRSKPFMMDAERAARRIARAVERGSARVAFPLPMAAGTRLLALLPASWATWIVRRLRY
jgi:short-subunit dehydrogenase